MRVESVTEITSEIVQFARARTPNEYKRYAADVWEVRYGESWEPVYGTSHLEEAYQSFKEKTK